MRAMGEAIVVGGNNSNDGFDGFDHGLWQCRQIKITTLPAATVVS